MEGIGKLTNAGFRVLFVSAWSHADKKTADIAFAAAWQDNETKILLKNGDRIATSHNLY